MFSINRVLLGVIFNSIYPSFLFKYLQPYLQVAKQADAELEVQQLRETLDEYNKEFVDVKNQVRPHVEG